MARQLLEELGIHSSGAMHTLTLVQLSISEAFQVFNHSCLPCLPGNFHKNCIHVTKRETFQLVYLN